MTAVRAEAIPGTEADTVQVTFVVAESGVEILADTAGFSNLMQVAVEHDVPNIEGECGGDMTCGTCHVYVEYAPPGYDVARSEDEIDMLEVVKDPTPASRLSCQLPVDACVGGLRLRVPEV